MLRSEEAKLEEEPTEDHAQEEDNGEPITIEFEPSKEAQYDEESDAKAPMENQANSNNEEPSMAQSVEEESSEGWLKQRKNPLMANQRQVQNKTMRLSKQAGQTPQEARPDHVKEKNKMR